MKYKMVNCSITGIRRQESTEKFRLLKAIIKDDLYSHLLQLHNKNPSTLDFNKSIYARI